MGYRNVMSWAFKSYATWFWIFVASLDQYVVKLGGSAFTFNYSRFPTRISLLSQHIRSHKHAKLLSQLTHLKIKCDGVRVSGVFMRHEPSLGRFLTEETLISSFTLSSTRRDDTDLPVKKNWTGSEKSKKFTKSWMLNHNKGCGSSCFSICKYKSFNSITALLIQQKLSLTLNSAALCSIGHTCKVG